MRLFSNKRRFRFWMLIAPSAFFFALPCVAQEARVLSAAPSKLSAAVHGAASEVSGSMVLLDTGNGLWMVDCGAYYPDGPGSREESEERASERNQRLPCDATAVSGVFITHAHLDHMGRLPLLVRQGYRGRIHVTNETAAIAPIMLRGQAQYDTSRIRDWRWSAGQEKQGRAVVLHWAGCEWAARIKSPVTRKCRLADFENEKPFVFSPCKACAALEIEPILSLISVHDYESISSIAQGVCVTFLPAGHIPGSASILFEVALAGSKRRILFSGDLGNHLSSLLEGPRPAPPVDAVFVEATYGAVRRSGGVFEEFGKFREMVGLSVKNGGAAWIPAFALDRTQKILHQISQAKEEGSVPESVPVYCLSPTAAEISALYRSSAGRGIWFRKGISPGSFTPPGLLESLPRGKTAEDIQWPCIIVTTSGMLESAFSRSLAPRMIGSADAGLFLVGWQDPISPGGQIKSGCEEIDLDGEKVRVKAQVHVFNCFSGHGDAADIDEWLAGIPRESRVILVHGSTESLTGRKEDLASKGWKEVVIAKEGETVLEFR